MFVFTARTLLAEMEHFAPDVLAAVRKAIASRVQDLDFVRLDPAAFGASPKTSSALTTMKAALGTAGIDTCRW